MHEFEGDWYSWSIVHNGEDPGKYISAFRHFVDRFRAKGASKVKWMWCVNSDYAPYKHFNWIVNAYPGDQYVDIVATDIYNNHFPTDVPWWRSFKWQTTESYYYLTKYIPNKPLYICELGCRERFSSESTSSESKGAWYARMDKELQSNFRKARALIFFHAAPDQNWHVNTSAGSLQSLTDNVWNDDYYFRQPAGPAVTPTKEEEKAGGLYLYPNPTESKTTLLYASKDVKEEITVSICDMYGRRIHVENLGYNAESFSRTLDLSIYPRGFYSVEVSCQRRGDTGKKRLRVAKKLVLR
jgi:hypothetical protein